MMSPAAAIAWSLWTRNRTSFIASAATLAAMAIVFPLLAAVTSAGASTIASVVPLVGIFAAVMHALLFVEDAGSLSSRYPRHMLTLPVRTRVLAFWPMLFASAGAGLLWVAAALLIYRPGGHQLPVVVPAFGVAALMAWAQALAWLPIAVFWLRAIMNYLVVVALAALPVWLTFAGRGSAALITTLLIVCIAAAYVVAWTAVTSDRRGQSWRFWPAHAPVARLANPLAFARRRRPFRSPFEAQVWYEWNCHGLMLNGFVGLMLFSTWGILFLKGSNGSPQWLGMIIVILPIGVVSAIASTGMSLGLFRPLWSHSPVTFIANTFVATRPMTTGRMVAAKFRMSAVSVLCTWALAVAGTTFWIVVSDNLDNATIVARDSLHRYPGGRAFAIVALACVLLPALSWTLLTEGVVPLLAGRRWVANGSGWVFLAFLAGVGCCGLFLENRPEHLARFYSVLPSLVAGLATLKGAAAVAAFRAALRLGLMSWRNIVSVLSLWLILTGCGVALAILLGPTSAVPVSGLTLAVGIATFVPLARFPLATLALDWNRHR